MKVAEAALSFAVGKLGEALIDKVMFVQGVEDQVNLLKDELEIMYGLLHDATQKQAMSNGICAWISEIRKVAHDVEDVIETFAVKVDYPRRSSRGMFENVVRLPIEANHLNKLGKEIEGIRLRLKALFDSRIMYGIVQDFGDEGPRLRSPNIALEGRRLVPQGRDRDVVGLDCNVRRLGREGLLTEGLGLSVARITGMGGIGKSTLAREVYNDADVVARFKCRAWVVVSEDFNSRQVIKQLVLNLVGRRRNMDEIPLEELKGMLYQYLEDKEYFIVLDDVWRQEHWESLADAFPADQRDKRSRLLVTSRTQTVPSIALYRHELTPLDPNLSWQLFLKKSGCANGNCPPELEGIGRQIEGKCGGLPLAITVIGGLVREQRQSRSAWLKVLKDLNSHLRRNDNRISAVLELSYNDLSPLLKSCFLCLAFFKEDSIIRAEKLIQVWIAEGLITEERGGGGGRTMEETSISCLDELINRNMLQVKDMNEHDEVASCQIHDLLHELSIKKAEVEIGFKILKEGIYSQASDESRHRAIYCSTEEFSLLENPTNKHVRSLFFHGAFNIQGTPSLKFTNFALLRLLDFEGFGLWMLPETICELIGLKYLNLRNNNLRLLPSSLGDLKNLQVLDLFGNYGVTVPNIIWKLDNLRHLYMNDFNVGREATLRLHTLKNLQTLILFPRNDNWLPQDLIKMTNLCKLEVNVDASITNVREFITSLGELMNLTSLKLRLVRRNTMLEGLVITR